MSKKGEIYDLLKDVWTALTADQRICWHFTAAKNPITLESGELWTPNGWQFFVLKNSPLAVVNPSLILNDPPEDNTPPNTPTITATNWKLPSKLGAGGSTKHPGPRVKFFWPKTPKSAAIVKQEYTHFKGAHSVSPQSQKITLAFANKTRVLQASPPLEYVTTGLTPAQQVDAQNQSKHPSTRHVKVYEEGDADEFGLDVSSGYYSITAGNNRFGKIRGRTARRRPDLPMGRIVFINPLNGATVEKTIPNPTGRS